MSAKHVVDEADVVGGPGVSVLLDVVSTRSKSAHLVDSRPVSVMR